MVAANFSPIPLEGECFWPSSTLGEKSDGLQGLRGRDEDELQIEFLRFPSEIRDAQLHREGIF